MDYKYEKGEEHISDTLLNFDGLKEGVPTTPTVPAVSAATAVPPTVVAAAIATDAKSTGTLKSTDGLNNVILYVSVKWTGFEIHRLSQKVTSRHCL